MESSTENEHAVWTVPQCSFAISYSLRVLDDIRIAVTDAFFSLPRGGAEIGGLLLGTHDDQRVAISDYVPFNCEHALGPSFTLSPSDEVRLADMIRQYGERIVGWYHSHTRSEILFSETDQSVHSRFFPEPWQIALVLKPHTFQPMRAGFFFRGVGGAIHSAATLREFVVDPQPVRPVPPEEAPAPPPVVGDPVPSPRVVANDPARLDPAPIAAAVSASASGSAVPALVGPAVPSFTSVEPAPSRRWWIAALCVSIGLAIGALAYQSRELWWPHLQELTPAKDSSRASAASEPMPLYIALTATEREGELQIRWDRNSPAIRGGNRGALTIVDSGDTRRLDLDQDHLRSGSVIYIRESDRVDVSMTVELPTGQLLREATQFLGTIPSESKDPTLLQHVEDLSAENERLKAEALRQSERARKAEKALSDFSREQQRKRNGNQLPDAVK